MSSYIQSTSHHYNHPHITLYIKLFFILSRCKMLILIIFSLSLSSWSELLSFEPFRKFLYIMHPMANNTLSVAHITTKTNI